MSISVNSIFDYVTIENQHPRLVGILRNNFYKYYFEDMNAAIAVVLRLNQYLNHRNYGEDLFMISTKIKHRSCFNLNRVQYNTNKGMLKLFLENEAYDKEAYRSTIGFGTAVQSFERDWIPKSLSPPVIGDMVSVDSYMNSLRKQLDCLEEYKCNKEQLTSLAGERLECSSNRRAYIRAFELDCELMYDTLCDDVIGVIREFVGEEFLESVRRRTISKKYFPSPRKDSMILTLNTWRLSDLKQYSKHMFIAHEFRWVPRTKPLLIERIMSNKIGFFELHRDIACLTKVFQEKKEQERQLKRDVAKDRAAALALTRALTQASTRNS